MTFETILGVTEILCSFQLVLKEKTGKDISQSSILKFLGMLLGNNLALSDAEDNTYGPLNRRRIADLPLLRTLLAICQKYQDPSFWEVMHSFVLLAYVSWAASTVTVRDASRVNHLSKVTWGRCNFCGFTTSPPLPNSPKNQNFKKQEKKHAEISAFNTSVTKNMITWCTVPEMWCAANWQTDGQTKKVT